MGIIISIPQIDGLTTVLSLSSTTPSTSYAFDPTKDSAFAVSTTMFNQSHTGVTSISAVPIVQTNFAPPVDTTDDTLIDDPTTLALTKTITTYIHTATVISEIKSTSLITATTTVAASCCPTRMVQNTLQSVPSIRVHSTSTVETPTYSSPPVFSSQLSTHSFTRLSERRGHITHTSVLAHSRLPETVISHYGTFSHNRLPGSGAESTSLTRVAWMPHFDRGVIAIRGPDDTSSESKYKPSAIGPSADIMKLDRVTRTRLALTVLGPTRWERKNTLTKTKDVTTTTVYTNAITNHTTTTTITAFPLSCTTSRTSTSSSTSSTSCTSATANPNPPANDTCAEDGLLEYSNIPQPPDTLEGCAVACLADASCLSFTFVPSERECYTSLYPLVDSAFAGTQQYHIYNYDRDCYSCSS